MSSSQLPAGEPIGFEGAGDIGAPDRNGHATYDAKTNTYNVAGGGRDIWASKDDFFFLWKHIEGDVSLCADITLLGEGKRQFRKGGLMIRAGLETDAAYADVMVHGNGWIGLQYRQEKGGDTKEVRAPIEAPATVRLERRGDQFSLDILGANDEVFPVGTVTVELPEKALAGLATCACAYETVETARFANVKLDALGKFGPAERVTESTLEIFEVSSGIRRVLRRSAEHFEAPNWSRDGNTLLYNRDGRLFTIPVSGGTPSQVDTGFAGNCNNDHGYAPDGSQLAISHTPDEDSLIYILPANGGTPQLVTEVGPSYWHGWSPDGNTLAYCASRNGQYDIYTIGKSGGDERQLTNTPGLDDGPDYSPDGKFIFFNSVRTGQMKIWRMRSDGSDQTQVTPDDEYGDWFAHPSPDGKWLVYVAYDKSVDGHPENKNVVLRMMPMAGGEPQTIATLFGGQGTINVPSWAPDSSAFAFVSYRLIGG